MTTIYHLPVTGEQRDFLLHLLGNLGSDTAHFLYGHLVNAQEWVGRVVPPIYLDGDGKLLLPFEHGRPEAVSEERLAASGITDPPRPTTRDDVLERAGELIGGDRAATYGDAATSFGRISMLWSSILDAEVTATDVARMMIAMKLSRLHQSSDHADSWVDIAGYAALGAEIAGVEL